MQPTEILKATKKSRTTIEFYSYHLWCPNLPTCFLVFPINISSLYYFYETFLLLTAWYSKTLLKLHIISYS